MYKIDYKTSENTCTEGSEQNRDLTHISESCSNFRQLVAE